MISFRSKFVYKVFTLFCHFSVPLKEKGISFQSCWALQTVEYLFMPLYTETLLSPLQVVICQTFFSSTYRGGGSYLFNISCNLDRGVLGIFLNLSILLSSRLQWVFSEPLALEHPKHKVSWSDPLQGLELLGVLCVVWHVRVNQRKWPEFSQKQLGPECLETGGALFSSLNMQHAQDWKANMMLRDYSSGGAHRTRCPAPSCFLSRSVLLLMKHLSYLFFI